LAELGLWGVLALRQAVDAVVEQDNRDVDVAAQRVQKVVAADTEAVAVAGDDEDLEVTARCLEAGGYRRRAAVDAVEAVSVHVIRQAAGAADARDEDDLLPRHAEIGHQLLGLRQDRVVAAAGARSHFLV